MMDKNHNFSSLAVAETKIDELADLGSYKFMPEKDHITQHYRILAMETLFNVLPREVQIPLSATMMNQLRYIDNEELNYLDLQNLV